MFDVDLNQLIKYDKPGPRYTSYPTAPHFSEDFNYNDYLKRIQETNKGNNLADLSLYFHLPFCDTLCYFCGCHVIISRNRDRIRKYLDYVLREIDLVKPYLHPERKVEQLHWGGGTPTHLSPEEIRDLSAYINKKFNFTDDAELGCEIDPRELERGHLEALREGGFNRISMGVQDFNEKVQKVVNRNQPEEMTRKVVNWVRELGFDSINLDLIYGLPFQTVKTFTETLDKIIAISPDRLAVFNYAHVPWMKRNQVVIREEDLPSPETKLQLLKLTIEKLTDAGYVYIGMDHFAKPEDDLAIALKEKKMYRNFQGYSTHSGADLYSFGISSISQLPGFYAQNLKKEKEYFEAIDNKKLPVFRGYMLNEDDVIRQKVIMKLMCDFDLSFKDIENEFSIDFKEYFKHGLASLKPMVDDNLVSISDDGIVVSEKGQLLIRNIAINFDGYMERKQDTAKYSRTV